MASGLGLLGAGLKTKEQALRGLTTAAQEEARNKALEEQIKGQKYAAEQNQASTLGSTGAAIGYIGATGGGAFGASMGAKFGAAAGPVGALIGAAAGFLFSKIF